jgi:hypothetical protein
MSIFVEGATMRPDLDLIGVRRKGLQYSVTRDSASNDIPTGITATMTFHAYIARQAINLYSRVIEPFVFSLRRDSLAS